MTRGSEQDILSLRPRHSAEAACEPIGDGAVALHVARGVYYELDAVGLFVWNHCTGERDGTALAELMARQYAIPSATAQADLRRFLKQLLQAGLIAPAEAEE
jgi:hypothetical protein